MTIANYTTGRTRTVKAGGIPVGHPGWNAARAAYEQVRDGRPPDYDQTWGVRVSCAHMAQEIYELAREACLTLKLADMLPPWPRNRREPVILGQTRRAIRQERRLGREANLVVTLTPPPVEAGAELASVY